MDWKSGKRLRVTHLFLIVPEALDILLNFNLKNSGLVASLLSGETKKAYYDLEHMEGFMFV